MPFLGAVLKLTLKVTSWSASEDIPVPICNRIITIKARQPSISSIIQITEQQEQTNFFNILIL